GLNKIDLASWRSFSGQDVHSVISSAAAVFVNSGNSDFHLKSGSPAINFGVPSLSGAPAPTVDMEGLIRPAGGAWDAGAFEFGGTPSGVQAALATGAAIDNFYDFNRDGRVDNSDEFIARCNVANFISALALISVPQGSSQTLVPGPIPPGDNS